jgi:hypothetical protein
VSIDHQVSVISQAVSALSQAVSVLSQSVSVLSQSVSVLSQSVSVISVKMDTLSNQISVISQELSIMGDPARAYLASIVTISATALTNIPALSIQLSAGISYEIRGRLLYTFSGVSSGNAGFGMTFPAMVSSQYGAAGYIEVGQQGNQATASAKRRGYFTGAGSGSNIVSGFTLTTSAVPYYAVIDGVMLASANGSWVMQAKATSAGTGAIHILPGSYLRTFRIN